MTERFVEVDKIIRENGLENVKFAIIDFYDDFFPRGIKSQGESNILFVGRFEDSKEEGVIDIEDIDYITIYSTKICYATNFVISLSVENEDNVNEVLNGEEIEELLEGQLVDIEWYLTSPQEGRVIVTSKEELTRDDLDELSEFIARKTKEKYIDSLSTDDFYLRPYRERIEIVDIFSSMV